MPRRLILLAALAGLMLPTTAHAAASGSGLRPVTATLPSRLTGARTVGAAPAGQRLTIGVLLAHPNPAGEDALLKDLSDRTSSRYHQFLTPEAYAQRFGVTAQTQDAARAWLRSSGLEVLTTSRAGDYIAATGTVAQIARLAHVRMGLVERGGERYVANLDAPQVPHSLPVLELLGLNTFERYRPLSTQAGPDVGNRTPQELWSIYEQPAAQTGQGVPVAILGSGATDQVIKDLHTFDRKNGFPEVPVDVVHTPANGDYTDDGGNVEWNIDMQAIHGMAPGIDREVLYFSPTLNDSELTASLATWVNDPSGPPIMNASLGECEEVPVVNPILNNAALKPVNGNDGGTLPVSQAISQASEPATTMLLQQAVIEGRNFFASSGDNGSSCTLVYPGTNGVGNYAVPLTSDPASTPFTNAVGGTVLYSDGQRPAGRALERAWEYSGGNASPFIPAPDFQKGVPNLNRPCVLDRTGAPTNTGQLCRGVPDVAALSGDVVSNGYTIVSNGKDSGGGGTSLSSPLWAGMWARVLGSAPKGSTGFGFANEAFYAIAKDPTRYARSFFDITVGSNGLNPALPGYDYVTGLGAPKVAGLIKDVPAVAPPRFPGQRSGAGGGPGGPGGSAGSSGTAGCRDTLAPLSRFARRGSHLTRKRGVALRGTSSDRGCGRGGAGALARVTVSIGRKTGSRCRFLRANGRFGRATSCKRTTYLLAKGTTRWSLRLRHRLPRGSYQVYVRGIDRARNYERKASARNLLRLRVR